MTSLPFLVLRLNNVDQRWKKVKWGAHPHRVRDTHTHTHSAELSDSPEATVISYSFKRKKLYGVPVLDKELGK